MRVELTGPLNDLCQERLDDVAVNVGQPVVAPLEAECEPRMVDSWDPLESTCRHASLSIL